mmetsp:Transcript_27790/g.34333  ORF Transcript_27790/g.34333 Transcript_27790/m.34333 type:complete len:421 (-) Transcript_27790:119-1381(-)
MCKSSSSEDKTTAHAWVFEDETADTGKGALTTNGIENIANHKYKSGHYTYLDNFLNPFWTYITDLLPMTVAPNMVTTMGGFQCFISYCVLWYHSPNMDQVVPDWVVLLSGLCTVGYYTFDCMDGKQARRTGTSSPLGQLFDHGFDCLCLMSHVSATSGYVMIGGSNWYLAMQTSLQFSFFMAQWEEYYTEILPHAMGNFGVTEVNYGIGLFTAFNAFIEREQFWLSKVKDVFIFEQFAKYVPIPELLGNLELRHFALCGWFASLAILISGSLLRVFTHENVKKNGIHLSALSKLCTPILISIAPFCLPSNILFNRTRSVSIATGLLFTLLTKKMIVFSMAKMTYAAVQTTALPLLMGFLWIRFDKNITEEGATLLLSMLSVYYVYQLLSWVSKAINQICKKLDIYCFSIKAKSDSTKKAN